VLLRLEICQPFASGEDEKDDSEQEDGGAWKAAAWTRAAERVSTGQIVEDCLKDQVAADKAADQEEPVLSQRVIEGSGISQEPVEDPLKNGQGLRVYLRAALKRLPGSQVTFDYSDE